MMSKSPFRQDFVTVEPIEKGLSSDRKFRVETADGQRLLLRIAGIAEYDRVEAEFRMAARAAAHGVPVPSSIDFGICDDGECVYSLSAWCDGEDVETVLSTLTDTEQYILGIEAGRILRQIHSIPAPDVPNDWGKRYDDTVGVRLNAYQDGSIHFDGDQYILDYLRNSRHLLDHRPQCVHHGDFHAANMMVSAGELFVVDWSRADYDNYGDPWAEFNRIVGSTQTHPHFASGQIKGYFNGKPPAQFWPLLAYYLSAATITAIQWATQFGEDEVASMIRLNVDLLKWYDNMRNPIPSWYIQDLHIQYTDGIPHKLKQPYDLSFISRYGKVFKVFDDQDSGNICFGAEKDGQRYFIKFAGAPTACAVCSADEAIANLESATQVYHDLAHPNLIKLLADERVGGGYAAVFEWADGNCMGRMYPASHRKFKAMPIEAKLRVFEDILAFHRHVAERGYVAIDFYDGSIMFDLDKDKTTICDIDFYAKRPYINRMGRLWGSSRYMSPEEFTLGAEIDEVTNVYTMGAMAFALFSEYDRTPVKWPLGERLYAVAKKAVSDNRDARQQSIRQLNEEWMEAKA